MKKAISILLASAAAVAVVSVSATAGYQLAASDGYGPSSLKNRIENAAEITLASGHRHKDKKYSGKSKYDDDDHHDRKHRHHDDDDDDDDDDYGAIGTDAPAVNGPVAPPANGLFGNGAAPQVQVN